MSADCATAVGEMVDAVEYGSQPWPIFFSDLGCSSGQWPPQGYDLSNITLNTPFSLRLAACNQAPGVPAELISSSETNTINSTDCFLPLIQSGIVPPGFKITFYAANPTDQVQPPFAPPVPGGTVTVDPGVFVLINSAAVVNPLINPNSLLLIQEGSSAPRWGSSVIGAPGSTTCSDGNTTYTASDVGPWYPPPSWPYANSDAQSQALQALFDGDGKQKLSLYSCGSPFWPSLTSVLRNNDTYGTPQSDGAGNWNLFVRGVQSFADGGFCFSTSAFARAATTGSNNSYLLNHYVDSTKTCGPGGPTYTTGDCIGSLPAFGAGVPPPSGDFNIKGCACHNNPDNPNYCAIGDTCQCPTQMQGNGSLDRVQIELVNGSWEIQQFLYCVGLERFTLGGFPIQRYGSGNGDGTVACDPIVTTLCQNTAFVASNPQYAKACSCVLEQQRFNIQFAGLDLPVQCFSSICANNDPAVYRTTQQSQGCSARLCSQIITINGSAIAAEGYQTLLCDGTPYVINTTTNVSPGPVPIVTATVPSNLNLGPTFYIALGLLGVMVLLLVAWGIRKGVLTHRQQQQQRHEVLQALERTLASAA